MTRDDPAMQEFVDEARRVDILSAFERAGGSVSSLRRQSHEMVGPCPVHGGRRDKLQINPRDNVYLCRGDDHGGDAIGLYRHLTGADFLDACEALTGRDRPRHDPNQSPQQVAQRRAEAEQRIAASRAEAEARARGLRVIVPLRPGYGSSDMVAHGADYDAALLEDTERVLRAEGVRRCPVLSLGGDVYYAARLARRDPARITGILACAGMLPLTRRAQFERMDKWHRFILAGAKYTPHLLPFMVKAGFLLARRIGKGGFARAIYGESGADIATFEDPEVYEAIVGGSEVALSATHSAHEAFARQLVGGQLEDWSGDLVALKGALPVILMNGAQDPQVPRATYEEFRRDHPWIEYHLFEDAGQLVFFRHWRAALDRLAPLVAEADAK